MGRIEAPVALNSTAADTAGAKGAARRLARWGYPAWMILICGFALLHALHLGADFPNNTPWIFDFAKYTDEGWWGNAAVRAHLFGHWYLAGDFNPAAAVPVWPLLEWVVFCFTGVAIEAARGLAVALFFANLLLSYFFLRARGPRWMALLAITFLVTSPFLYCFCRLAILEPLLTAVFLGALNLAVRLVRHPSGAKARDEFTAVVARLKWLRKNGEWATNSRGAGIAGAKARVDFAAFAARLKSRPVTKQVLQRVFPQSLKSCPDTKQPTKRLSPLGVESCPDAKQAAKRVSPGPAWKPIGVSIVIGLLFTVMMLSKTTAVFLLPAIGWAMIQPLWHQRRTAIRCALAALGTAAVTFGLWMALIVHFGLMRDYQYLLFVNKYDKPTEFYWPLFSLWWSLRGALWADHILVPLGGIVALAALAAWRSCWSRSLRNNPVFCSSVLAVAGYILFMTYQNHPQPRYFTVIAFFSFFVVAMGIEALLSASPWQGVLGWDGGSPRGVDPAWSRRPVWKRFGAAWLGVSILVGAVIAVCLNGEWTVAFVLRPEYTFVPAAQKLTRYIDQHPNGKRLLVSTSGDEITMVTHLPSMGDDFGTEDLVSKLGVYAPGWFAAWNVVDRGTLEDLHTRYSLEQVALFHAYDSPDRNMLVLFKLHPLPGGQVRDPDVQNLQVALPGDKIEVPIE